MTADKPITIAILAMGGEGGGVLADWLVHIGEQAGYLAQKTSGPGVAQRTGATIYYVELFPRGAGALAVRNSRRAAGGWGTGAWSMSMPMKTISCRRSPNVRGRSGPGGSRSKSAAIRARSGGWVGHACSGVAAHHGPSRSMEKKCPACDQ